MTDDEQISDWVAGNSRHNPDKDECCPDFSCCQTHYKAPLDERILFRDRPEIRHKLMAGFLEAVFLETGASVCCSVEGRA